MTILGKKLTPACDFTSTTDRQTSVTLTVAASYWTEMKSLDGGAASH
ncbi:MAG: hypothetical protein LW870_21950 [Pirellula sp.]|nr:hypothetical protein [Pirellula sp.]